MPNYYYVKSGGTATGDGGRATSQRTGAFSAMGGTSTYYASIEDATSNSTTAPAHGDIVCISNSSALSTATAFDYNNAPNGTGKGVSIICVDDSNCENSAIASTALEYITGGASDWTISNTDGGIVSIYGVYAKSDDDIVLAAGDASKIDAYQCTFEVTGTGDSIYGGGVSALGAMIRLFDCTLKIYNNFDAVNYGAHLEMYGGSITVGTGGAIIQSSGFSGGGYAKFVGVDLSAATTDIINFSPTDTKERLLFQFRRCRVASGVEFWDSADTLRFEHRVEATNCAHDSTAEWQYYVREEQCEAEATSSTYRNQSVAWPVTGSKTSIAVDVATSGNTSPMRPFSFDLPSRYAALSASATDEITVYLSGQSSLTDKEVWIELIYPDGTSSWVPNQVFSSGAPFDPFATGTGLTSDGTSTWTSGGAANYKISVNTGTVDAGEDCVPIIRMHVQGLSSTLYVDWLVDLS